MLDRQIQDPVSDIPVLLPPRAVREPLDAHLPKHAVQRTPMTRFDRAALHAMLVTNPVQTLLAQRAEVQMVLQKTAQQLPPGAIKTSLQIPVLTPGRLRRRQTADDLLKTLARAGERIPVTTGLRRGIRPSRITTALALHEFISRRRNYLATGVGVGGHEAHLPGSTLDYVNANFGARPASPPAYHHSQTVTLAKVPPLAIPQPRILNELAGLPSLYTSRTRLIRLVTASTKLRDLLLQRTKAGRAAS